MTQSTSIESTILKALRDVPDFPKPGIVFKDITPILSTPPVFAQVIDNMAQIISTFQPSHIAGIEARGFLFGTPIARQLKLPFVPVRKPGRLPWKKKSIAYTLEYGEATIEIHEDALGEGKLKRVAIVDDLLATGGTTKASCELIQALGGQVVLASFVVELGFLSGRKVLEDTVPVRSLAIVS